MPRLVAFLCLFVLSLGFDSSSLSESLSESMLSDLDSPKNPATASTDFRDTVRAVKETKGGLSFLKEQVDRDFSRTATGTGTARPPVGAVGRGARFNGHTFVGGPQAAELNALRANGVVSLRRDQGVAQLRMAADNGISRSASSICAEAFKTSLKCPKRTIASSRSVYLIHISEAPKWVEASAALWKARKGTYAQLLLGDESWKVPQPDFAKDKSEARKARGGDDYGPGFYLGDDATFAKFYTDNQNEKAMLVFKLPANALAGLSVVNFGHSEAALLAGLRLGFDATNKGQGAPALDLIAENQRRFDLIVGTINDVNNKNPKPAINIDGTTAHVGARQKFGGRVPHQYVFATNAGCAALWDKAETVTAFVGAAVTDELLNLAKGREQPLAMPFTSMTAVTGNGCCSAPQKFQGRMTPEGAQPAKRK